jgi:hypothetical protein
MLFSRAGWDARASDSFIQSIQDGDGTE